MRVRRALSSRHETDRRLLDAGLVMRLRIEEKVRCLRPLIGHPRSRKITRW